MQIVEKLGSNLREIRQRTLKTLIFKLKTSKITTYDLLEPNLAIKLLTLLAAKEDTEIDLDILQIFEYFIKEARGRQLLNTFGFEILRDYSYKNPGNGKALDILRAISIPKDSEIAWQQPDKLEELEQSNNLTGLPDRVSEMLLHDQQELENRRKISLPSFKVNAARLLMFEVVTPQPQEEEQLLSWVNLLSGIPMSEKIELDLFHEICSKIGAQIFLQRSGLLYKVLEGFESNSQLRVERSIYYISALVNDWHILIRKLARDSTPDSPKQTPRRKQYSTETFTSDFNNFPSELGDSIYSRDDWMDIGIASALIYQEVVKLLRYNVGAGPIVRKVGVFLKPYLESLQLNGNHQEQMDLSKYILSFVTVIWDQVHASSSPYFVASVEVELICLGLELVEYLAPILPDTSILTSSIMEYISDSSVTFLELVSSVWLIGGSGKDSYKALSSLFQISSMRMKKVIAVQGMKAKLIPEYLEDLKDCVFSSKPYSNSKAKENEFCKKVLFNWSNLSAKVLKPYVPYLSAFYSLDEGRTVNVLLKKVALNENEQVFYHIRGLLSRDEKFREESSKLLDLEFEENLGLKDVLIFSPSFLSAMINFSNEPFRSLLSIDVALNVLQNFSTEAITSKLEEAISVMRDCLKEKYSRDVLLSRNVFNTLLKVLEMQIDKNCVSFDLINCLITLIQYDSSSMESFWKHTKIIYRLLRVLPKCDEKTRLETSKLFVYVSFYDGKSQGEVIVVPNCVFDSFFLYGVGKSSSDLQKFPGKLADCIWETFAVSQSSEFHSKMLLDNLDEFRKSSNHTDFLNSLSYLARLCGHLSFGFFFLRNGIAESLSKFLLNTPASAEDCQVLLAVLSFILALPSNHDSIAELLLISWPNLLSLSISVDNSILTGAFRVELLESLSCWITKCDDNTILRILEKRQLAPRLVETLKRTDHHLELITIFVRLTDMNDFIDYVDESCWHELVSLMIQNIFYTFQTPFGKKHHSNESYLACIILKNISRLVIGRGVSPEWDSCWQIDNSMNWLSLILNHEKDDFQVCAIALLGNLIMCNNTFIELCNSIPYFIDSCITIITSEFEILEKKKESVILLSNFFISLKMRSGIEISGLDSADDWKKNGFQTIGQIFGVLPELLEFNYQPLTEATSLLIFNLCCANKHLMRKSLKDYFVFTRLFENPQSDTNENTCLEYFCNFENKKIHKYSINATFGNIVRICSILIEGDANYCTYLIQQTNFLPYLKYVLDNLNLKERDIAPDCCILFALILQTHTPENFEFEKLPLNTETAFSLIADCVKYDEESARLSGYSFFSQYFWWTISLNRSDTLSTAQSALNSIVHILIENLFSFGSHKESNAIENCLQQILFNFVFAKEIALKESLFSRIEKQLLQLVDGKVDDAIFIRIESMVMLVSSLCANHVTSKMICCSPTLIYILSSILDPHETRFVKIHLAATDALRSLIKDCDSNSVKVCSSSSNYSSLAEMLVAHLGRPSLSLLLFEEYLSCIQVIASQKTSGGLLLKKGLIAKLVKCFFDCVKLKKQAHITSFLDLFLKLGSYSEAQISLVRIPDFVDNILELMVWKSENVAIPSLDLLRRLLLVRENKSVFLSNGTTLSLQVENFYSTISHLMKSKSLQIVNLATFSLWALIYDFEKAKVDFKNHDFEKILTAIETQKDEKSKMQKENKFLAKTVLQLMGK